MHTAPETPQNEMVFDPNLSKIKKRIQPLPHEERTINESAAHIKLNHAEKSQRARRLTRPRVLIRGSCAIRAALQRCLTSHCDICKFWKWLPLIFRIRRSSSIMLKPMMRSHCKATCYTKLASCFGRVTAVGGIHVSITRNVADPQSC